MRKAVVLLLALCFAQIAWSQQKPVFVGGLQQQLSLHRLMFRLSMHPSVGLQHKHHMLATGPVLLLKEFPAATHNLPKITGVHFTYQYFISANEHKKWRLYAEFIGKGQFFKEEWQSNYWDEATSAYVDSKQGGRELLLEAYSGLGVRYQFHPRLYVQSSATLGYGFSQLKRTGASPAGPDNNLDYRAYKNKDLAYAVNLGIFLRLRK